LLGEIELPALGVLRLLVRKARTEVHRRVVRRHDAGSGV
jgi:hypothetical protein